MSSSRKSQSGIYPGWLMVLTGFMSMALIYPVGISLMSLFIGPIGESFQISDTAVSIQFSLLTFSSMVGAIIAGSALQKLGLKKAITLASVVVIVANALYAFSPSIWINYVLSIIVGLFSPTITNVGIPVMVNTWFGKKLSGNAVGIAMIGSGVGAMVLTPVIAAVISQSLYGWRTAYLVLSGLSLVLYLPLVLFFVKDSPQAENVEKMGVDHSVDQSDSVSERHDYGLTFKQAKSQVVFYLMAITFLIVALVSLLFYTLSFGYFTQVGYSEGFASTLLSIQALALIAGKYGMGALSDRTNPYLASVVVAGLQFAGLVCILLMGQGVIFAILGMIFFGIGNALGTIAIPLVTQAVFGNIHYGQIVGIMNMFGGLGAALGPIISTSLLNISGGYTIPWLVGAGGMILVVVFTLIIRRMSANLEEERRYSIQLH